MNQPTSPIDNLDLAGFRSAAEDAVAQAGEYVQSRFMGSLQVDSKSKQPGKDLVTDVDNRSQEIIESVMSKRYPDHQLLGEENQKRGINAKDIVWAVDPIDGTHNFVNQSATYAVCAGILYRGAPVAGAVWYPWPNAPGGSHIVSAHLGGGAQVSGQELQIGDPSDSTGSPVAGRLTALPINFRRGLRFSSEVRDKVGDIRVTGCAAQELLHVGTGIYQYSIVGIAAVWDFAAAAIIAREAGAKVLSTGDVRSWIDFDKWVDFEGWGLPYENDAATYERMRTWRGLILAAHPATAEYLKHNIVPKRPGMLTRIAMRLAKR